MEKALYYSMNTTVQRALGAQSMLGFLSFFLFFFFFFLKISLRNQIEMIALSLFKTMEKPHLENSLDPSQEIMALGNVWRTIN